MTSASDQSGAEGSKADNIKSLAASLRLNNPILSYETSQRVADDLFHSTDGWLPWSDLHKHTRVPMVIVCRDALGYVHNATHMIGSKGDTGPGFAEWWKQVLV